MQFACATATCRRRHALPSGEWGEQRGAWAIRHMPVSRDRDAPSAANLARPHGIAISPWWLGWSESGARAACNAPVSAAVEGDSRARAACKLSNHWKFHQFTSCFNMRWYLDRSIGMSFRCICLCSGLCSNFSDFFNPVAHCILSYKPTGNFNKIIFIKTSAKR